MECRTCGTAIEKNANYCSNCGLAQKKGVTKEPEFREYRRRVLTSALIICLAAIPIGFMLRMVVVWVLGVVGFVGAFLKLRRI